MGSSSTYATRGAVYSQGQNSFLGLLPVRCVVCPQSHPTWVPVRNFLFPSCNLRGMISDLGLREGDKKPSHGHVTVQNAPKYLSCGYDQQRLAGASCRIQTFAGNPTSTMIGGIRLGCPPSRSAIPPLGSIVPHGLLEKTPHLGSHADAQQPPQPRLVPPKEDLCVHPAVAPSKLLAVNNGMQHVFIKGVHILCS